MAREATTAIGYFIMEMRELIFSFFHFSQRPLSVTVIRNGKKVHLGLTPKRWAGKGLLG